MTFTPYPLFQPGDVAIYRGAPVTIIAVQPVQIGGETVFLYLVEPPPETLAPEADLSPAPEFG